MMNRTTFSEFKEKALRDPEVRKLYEELAPVYEEHRKKLEKKLQRKNTTVESNHQPT